MFSCPPYGDLERYSDDPADLSTFGWPEFCASYRQIIATALGMLRPDRFACFVVGDIRDRATGLYRNLPGATIEAFRDGGAHLYNEAILVTAVGSLPIRTSAQFPSGRKMGKTHQNVLVFVKGDPKRVVSQFEDWVVRELKGWEVGDGHDGGRRNSHVSTALEGNLFVITRHMGDDDFTVVPVMQ